METGLSRAEPSGLQMSATVKRCTCCRRAYTAAEFSALEYVGVQKSADETGSYRLVLRNCSCRSTIGIEYRVVEGEVAA